VNVVEKRAVRVWQQQQFGNGGRACERGIREEERKKGVFILGLRFFLIHLGLCFNPSLTPKYFKLSPP
jgi:hypothetical protein